MAMVWEQGELFPSADKSDVDRTRILLEEYSTMVDIVSGLKEREVRSAAEEKLLREWEPAIHNIVLAIEAIKNREIRDIMKYRFLNFYPRKAAVVKWHSFSERSLDRKILEGIGMVASTLKMLGIM
ncbi:hypothetical protein [Paenibacillus sp. sgz500992]|uniref:hypothetical protein n=1 Tax=Paenibacillus sp. sgz500992 TaxID=3242476 RepID=UPI0036D24F6A